MANVEAADDRFGSQLIDQCCEILSPTGYPRQEYVPSDSDDYDDGADQQRQPSRQAMLQSHGKQSTSISSSDVGPQALELARLIAEQENRKAPGTPVQPTLPSGERSITSIFGQQPNAT